MTERKFGKNIGTNVRLEHETGIYYFSTSIFPYSVEKGKQKYHFDIGDFFFPPIVTDIDIASFKKITDPYKISNFLSFEREQTREFVPKYSLGEYAFQPEALIPQKVTTTLTIEKAVLRRSGEFLKVFGFTPGNLLHQTRPVTIIEFFHYDAINDAEEILNSYAIIYEGCWLTSNPIEYDVTDDDTAVIQEVKMNVTKVSGIDLGAMASSAAAKTGGLITMGLIKLGVNVISGIKEKLKPKPFIVKNNMQAK